MRTTTCTHIAPGSATATPATCAHTGAVLGQLEAFLAAALRDPPALRTTACALADHAQALHRHRAAPSSNAAPRNPAPGDSVADVAIWTRMLALAAHDLSANQRRHATDVLALHRALGLLREQTTRVTHALASNQGAA